MVDQLNSFASEVTRVAAKVGTEGKLGGQAQVKGVAGTWKDLTENVNLMAANLTGQSATSPRSRRRGEWRPLEEDHGRCAREILELKNTINAMVDQLNSLPRGDACPRARSAPRASSAARPGSRA
jgi:HAMP domain-containing protein